MGWGFEWRENQILAGLIYHIGDSIKGASLISQIQNIVNNNEDWQLQILGTPDTANAEWILSENHSLTLTASTEHSKPHSAGHALFSNKKTYWAAKLKDAEQWWQMESKEVMQFSKMKFTGAPHGQSYMKAFDLSHSMDGKEWQIIEGLEGINDGFEIKEIKFEQTFNAKFLRINPKQYAGWPGFRIDFYAKQMQPNKIELQWLKPVSNAQEIEETFKEIPSKILIIKNFEGATF
jgi:hypothetical protein